MARLLDGIRVIDAANFIAGPVSTTVMADFGADVIKVERPEGDTLRNIAWRDPREIGRASCRERV